MTKANRFLKSSFFNALEKLLRIAINFVIFILMTKTLSVEDMGKYNFYLTAFAMLSVFSSFGLTENATKILLDKQCHIKALNVLIAIKLLCSLFFAAMGYFLLLDENIYFFIALIFSSFSLSLQFLESLALGKLILKVNTVILVFMSIIKIWAFWTNQNLNTFCQIFALEIFIQSFVLFVICYLKSIKLNIKESHFEILTSLNFKGFFYIWFSASLSILYLKIDQFFVKTYLNEHDVGLYTYATRIIDYGMLLPSLIISSSMGYLYTLKGEKRTTLYSSAILIASGMFVAVNLLSILLTWFFMPQYHASIGIVFILSLGLPFALIRALTGKFLIIDGHNQPFLIRATVLLLLNIVLCTLLIGKFGLYGVAMANMLTMIFSGFFIDLIHRDTIAVFKLKWLSLINLKSPSNVIKAIKKLG